MICKLLDNILSKLTLMKTFKYKFHCGTDAASGVLRLISLKLPVLLFICCLSYSKPESEK